MKRNAWLILIACLTLVAMTPFLLSVRSRNQAVDTRRKAVPARPKFVKSKKVVVPHDSTEVVRSTKQPTNSGLAVADETRIIGDSTTVAPSSSGLYRPGSQYSTRHYNFSEEVMPDEFLDHLQNMTRRIHRQWKAKGWSRFDKMNISDCDVSTPECRLFRDVLPPHQSIEIHHRAYTKCCVEHRLLREVAVWTLEKLNQANVSYFLSTGTALGAIRHGGTIIPWDTDIDIAIFPKDRQTVERLLTNNGEHHFHVDRLGKPMFWVHHSRNGKPMDGPHVEIFYDPVYTKYPEKLLPLEPCRMYGHRVNCPNRNMFSVWFPSGWQIYGGGHYHGDHRCTLYRNGKRYELEKC